MSWEPLNRHFPIAGHGKRVSGVSSGTYDILLKKGKHDMLYNGGLRNMATEIFKALHGSTPIYIRDLFEEKDKFYNLRSTVSLTQPKCNT